MGEESNLVHTIEKDKEGESIQREKSAQELRQVSINHQFANNNVTDQSLMLDGQTIVGEELG